MLIIRKLFFSPAASKVLAKSRTYFLRIYPYLHMLHSLTHLIYLVKYSLGSSTYHSPLNRLALNRVINLSPDRAKEMEARSGSGLAAAFTGGLSMGLEVGAFFLQFLDWW